MDSSANIVLQAFSGLASLAALITILLEFGRHGRTPERPLRPAVGWTVAVTGLTVAVVGAISLLNQSLSPFSRAGALFGVATAAGVLLLLAGALFALLAPSADRHLLRQIARAVVETVQESGLSTGRLARVVPRGQQESRPKRLVSQLAVSGVTMLHGAAGSGKSTAARLLAYRMCKRVLATRRPDDVVLYVDIACFKHLDESVTHATITEHLLASVRLDPPLATKLADLLARDGAPWRWTFVFDLGAGLSAAREAQYVEEVGRYVGSRRNSRAIVCGRALPAGGERDLEMAWFSPKDVHALLRQRGVLDPVLKKLTRRLEVDTDLAELARNPVTVTMFADHAAEIDLEPPAHDVLDALIGATLRSAGQPGAVALRELAEDIAFDLVRGVEPNLDAVHGGALEIAELGRTERGVFRFRSDSVLAHLAAARLLREAALPSLWDVVSDANWRAVLTAALRAGDQAFRARFLQAAGDLIGTQTSSLALVTDSPQPRASQFHWPTETLLVLQILSQGIPDARQLDASLRKTTDSLIRTAMTAGLHARKMALPEIALADQATVVALVNNFIGHVNLSSDVLRNLEHAVDFFEKLRFVTRLGVLVSVLVEGLIPRSAYASPVHDQANDFVHAVHGMLRVSQVASLVLAAFCAAQVVRDPREYFLPAIAIAVAVGYLWRLREHRRGGRWSPLLAGAMMAVVAVVGVVVVIANLVDVVGAVVDWNVSAVLTGLLLAYLLFWPLGAAAHVAMFPKERERRWWRLPLDLIPRLRKADVRLPKPRVRELLTPRRTFATLLVGTGISIVLVDLPLAKPIEDNVDPVAALVAFAAAFVMFESVSGKGRVSWRKDRWDHRELAMMDADALCGELKKSLDAGDAATLRFLTEARAAEKGALRAGLTLFQDLDSLLSFIEDTLPEVAKPIKAGWWHRCPPLLTPGLSEWLMDFDRRRPGKLVTLANSPGARSHISETVLNAGQIEYRT